VDLSVVIPAYNVEKYLAACLDSLLANEGVNDTEIIIVNDGSTDNTLSVAEEYSKKYRNIRVISRDNGGPSAARNLGLNEATGKYVFFCDADDLVVNRFLSILYRSIEKREIDVVLWCADIIDESGKVIKGKYRDYFCYKGINEKSRVYSGYDFMKKQLSSCGDFPSVIWLGAYSREYLLQKNLRFKDGMHHEDDLWVPQVVLNAKSVIYIPESLYKYRLRSGSLSKPICSKKTAYIDSLQFIYPYLYKYCEDRFEGDSILPLLKSSFTRKYLHWIFYYSFYRYGYLDSIDIRMLWNTSYRLRDKIRVLLLCILGRIGNYHE